MRLTVDLLLHCAARVNPLRARELDVRGYKISALENLAVLRDQCVPRAASRSLVCLSLVARLPHVTIRARTRRARRARASMLRGQGLPRSSLRAVRCGVVGRVR